VPPVEIEKEDFVRQLLVEQDHLPEDQQLSTRQIALRAGVSRGTVDRIREGRPVHRKGDEEEDLEDVADNLEELPFRLVDDYVCRGCSEEAGYVVLANTSPCQACAARTARRQRQLVPVRGGH
jgi:hypothetical protein